MRRRPIIVFDVNETLLDLDTLHPTLDRRFGDPAALRLWFASLITYSETLTLPGVYVPFTDIGAAVLRMLAVTRDITISDSDAAELTDRFATMPTHPEVPAALRRLREDGFRLFTLTDNTLAILGRQLEHAGVIDVFERRFMPTGPSGGTSRHPRPPTRSQPRSRSTPATSAWSPATCETPSALGRPVGRQV
jgi:2-haloacid dehalogenase